MKSLKVFLVLLFGFILFVSSKLVFAQGIEADSSVTAVTVYPDSALVSRSANLKLNAGEVKVVFPDIIPEIDENSLRVSAGTGEKEMKILGAEVKKEFLKEEPSERVRQIKEGLQNLEDEVKRLENNKRILAEEKEFLDSIRLFSKDQIPEDLVTKMPTAQDLDNTYKFLDVKLKDNFAQGMDAELKIREVQKKIDVLRRELAEVSGSQRKLKRSIVVELEVLKPLAVELNVSYLVRGAYWQPIYDIRADFENSEVEMVSYGIVRQTTGEDWKDVEISLSTAKPAIGGRMPYVEPWFLRPYQPPPIDRAASKSKSAFLGGQMQYEKVQEVAALAIPYSQAEEKGIAVVYNLTKKATIKSDGSEHKLLISSQVLSAKFEYSSYPRAVNSAYLGSRVTNAANLQLLAGRVNIFLEGDFVGTSSIDNIGPGEEFDLYLGVDENVKVKREQMEKKVDETLVAGIPSPTKRTTFKYKLTIENYKLKKINVKLFEAMPVPEDDRIKVKIDKVSIEPKEKDWKDRKGVWLWELELEPRQKQEIFYTIIVEHPREMPVEGL
ncbi:MAG: mucoidy inhibitor MuiA family protein [Candidatus Omnitrophica bacterium]|nr:mucoidy inhibitor MuiA family protein [Candidatus Omnitrophota bacterium]